MCQSVRLIIAFHLLVTVLLSAAPAYAVSNYTLTTAAVATGTFRPPVWYYRDDTNKLTLDQAKDLFVQNRFRRAGPEFNAGVGQPTYWFRVLLDVAPDFDAALNPLSYMEIADPILDRIDIVHYRNDQQVDTWQMGSALPFANRPIPTPTFVLPINMKAGDRHEFWLRVKTEHSMQLPLSVTTPGAYFYRQSAITYFYGSLIGLTLIMAFYNGLMGWRVQNISYLLYVGVLVSGAMQRLFTCGIGFEYFWPEYPQINAFIRPFMDNAVSFFSLLFTQNFLMTRSFAPLLHRCLSWLAIVVGTAALAVFVLPEKYSLYIALWLLLISFLVQYAVGIDCWLNKMRHAKLFLLGWFVFLGGGVILVFASLGALPLNNFTIHAVEIGLAIQVLALSFALSDRISYFQQEKLEAEQKNVESMSRYRELYEHSRDGLFEMLPDGRVVHMNPAFAKLLEVPGNLSDLMLWNFIASPHARESAQVQLTSGGQLLGLECLLATRSGKSIWTSLTLQPKEKNEVRTYDGVLRDISESKAKEEALRAQQQAEAATTAKSAFLANMSHEIRTPLTAIIGFAEDARDSDLSRQERNECIDTVVRSSYHLLDIINDVLDLSKIEAGKLELEQINMDLLELLADIQSVFGKRISSKGLAFTLDVRPPVPKQLLTDPTRLKQIVLNLLGNALKFTERGGVTLRVYYDADTDMLNLEVVDTGIGISPQQKEKIFQAFTQAELSTARNYGGTGLGLSIVKQLLEMMGGTIEVESEVGKGSTFRVRLHAHCAADAEMVTDLNNVEFRCSAAAENVIPQLRGLVLYAEDNPVNQTLVRALVSRTGAHIELVKNGAEAMLFALQRRPDVILMDISMPVISGVTATRLLRSHGYQGAIVACTANVMANEIERYLAGGFNACLEKPINRIRFYEVLSRFCPVRESTTQLTDDPSHPLPLSGKVLVAEDNSVNQIVIRKSLERIGLTVALADNGETALQRYRQGGFDVVLLDLEMPRLDGLHALEQLRAAGCSLPIFALTADNDPVTRRHCLEAGFTGVLLKPIDQLMVHRALADYLPIAPPSRGVAG